MIIAMLKRINSTSSLVSDITCNDENHTLVIDCDDEISLKESHDDLLKHETILPIDGNDNMSQHTDTEVSNTCARTKSSPSPIKKNLADMKIIDIWDLDNESNSCELMESKTVFSLPWIEGKLQAEDTEVACTTFPLLDIFPEEISFYSSQAEDSKRNLYADKIHKIGGKGKRKSQHSESSLACVSHDGMLQDNIPPVTPSPKSTKRIKLLT